jgi:hypothetical protein
MYPGGLGATKSIGSQHVDENTDGTAAAAAAVTATIPSMALFGIQPAVVFVVVVGDVSAVSYYGNGCAMTLGAWMRRPSWSVVLESGVHSPGFGQEIDGMRSASVLGGE